MENSPVAEKLSQLLDLISSIPNFAFEDMRSDDEEEECEEEEEEENQEEEEEHEEEEEEEEEEGFVSSKEGAVDEANLPATTLAPDHAPAPTPVRAAAPAPAPTPGPSHTPTIPFPPSAPSPSFTVPSTSTLTSTSPSPVPSTPPCTIISAAGSDTQTALLKRLHGPEHVGASASAHKVSPMEAGDRAELCPCCGGTATPNHQCGKEVPDLLGMEATAGHSGRADSVPARKAGTSEYYSKVTGDSEKNNYEKQGCVDEVSQGVLEGQQGEETSQNPASKHDTEQLEEAVKMESEKMLNPVQKAIVRNFSLPKIFPGLSLKTNSNFLLFGPGGTGKSTLAKFIAEEANAELKHIEIRHVLSKYHGESEALLGEHFDMASERADNGERTVLLFDEVSKQI
jgi:hypothetical protein